MQKNKKNKIIERQLKNNESPELKTIIKIVVGIALFFGIVYFGAGLLTGDIKLKKEKKEVEIQYSEILAEKTFLQNNSEYYVMYYNFDSNDTELITAIISTLSKDTTVYTVDLDKNFNKNYISSEIDTKTPSNSSELKVTSPTLIKIKNKKVVNFITGLENIVEHASN